MRRRTPRATDSAVALLYVVLVLAVGGGLLLASVSVASAQSVPTGGNSTGTDSTATPEQDGEFIDNATTLVSAEYDNETGRATVVIRSETIQEVTISDGGALVAGGEVNTRTVSIAPKETTTVTLDVTKTDSGFVGVAIATDDVLYAVPIDSPSGGDSEPANPFARTPSTAGWVGGASAVMVMGIAAAWYVKRDTMEEPEQME